MDNRAVRVRQAEPDDLDDLIRMARAFHAASCYAATVQMDPRSFAETVAGMATGGGVVLVAERFGKACGMAAAITYPHWFNKDHLSGQEVFWWVDPEARGTRAGFMLMKGLEQWAREAGCKTFHMASTANLAPEKLAKVYERMGYRPQDIYYTKVM